MTRITCLFCKILSSPDLIY